MTHLGDLDIFARVVTTGSMTAAGKALGLSPAVVSKRIRKLEERLGTRLLQRTTRQVALTDSGQGFYQRVVAILAGLEEAEAFVTGRSERVQGVLKMSAPTSFGRMHIAPHLGDFMARFPDLTVSLTLTDAFTDLIGEGYDVAIRIAAPVDSSLVARRLAPVRRVLCAAPSYLAAHGVPERVEDLRRHFCLPPHNNDAWKLEGPEGEVTVRPEGRLVTNSSEVIREAALAGLGIALRSTWDVGAELREGRLVQVLPAYEGSRTVMLAAVYPSREFLPAKVRHVIDYLAGLYGPTPYWDA